jgi:rfaE bifunctional protein nucleotidyltransferase chain/domain
VPLPVGLAPAAKLLDRAEAIRWRRGIAGPVVFTNGVFDVLHRGHVAYLAAARAEGAALIVGVNTDASVRRLGKGPGRPLNGEGDRAYVLAGLAAVDAVTLFDEDTPLALIAALQPDVLAKGADYDREAIVGADLVEARGGRVVRVPLEPGQSTTNILEKIRRLPSRS